MSRITYLDCQMAGLEFEDWPLEAQDNWYEKCQLDAEEKYYREHQYDEEEDEEEEE